MGKAVIFDFDGVIIDSTKVQKMALLESYRLVVGNGTPSFDEFFSHSGDSLENIFLKMKLPLEMIEPYKRFSHERIGSIRIYSGIKELLAQLKAEGYKRGLCTGKDRYRTLEILEKLALDGYFETIVCSDDVENPKPHPDSLLLAINNLGMGPDGAVMVGDAKNDIICAKNAGVRSIAVTWGDMARETFEIEHPDCIVNSVVELSAAIDNLAGNRKLYRIS